MTKQSSGFHPFHIVMAWAVHAFTGSAAFIGLLTLVEIYHQNYKTALWLMAIAVVIDAIDGTFARLVNVKAVLPKIDGALLDNIVDYLNYVITPAFFLFAKQDMLPAAYASAILCAVVMTSAYQFCQDDAKTPDHFFKGFPCYWNIAVFYMFLFNTSMTTNSVILIVLSVLIFVPIKYVYPSRLDYLTKSVKLKILMHTLSTIYAISSGLLLWSYPNINPVYLILSSIYIVIYFGLSFYRTYSPLFLAKKKSAKKS